MENERYTILVIDDEEININLYKDSFKEEGYEIITAHNGKEALDIIVSREPDCIVSDIMMPQMTGIELLKILKSNPQTAFIPVILVTGLGDFEDVLKGLEAGADDYLVKPINIIELKTRVKGALKTSQLQRSLKSANRTISLLTGYSTDLISTFDPLTYRYELFLHRIIDLFLNNTTGFVRNTPWGILSGSLKGEYILGELFFASEEGLIQSRPVEIPKRLFINDTIRGNGVYLQNNLSRETIEFDGYRVQLENYAVIVTTADVIIFINFRHTITHYETQIFNHLLLLFESFKRLSLQIRETEKAFKYTVDALSRAAEANDEDTGNHIIRVNEYSRALAQELRQSDRFIDEIGFMAQMHDVGKIHIHPDILRKNGPLSQEEFNEIKKHPEYGAKILGDEPRLRMARDIALTHHERADGSGYPKGLKKDQIPLEGKIVAIADVYDALRNPRSYKPAFDHEKAVRIIKEGDGRTMPSHFDEEVLKAFLRIEKVFDEIYNKLK